MSARRGPNFASVGRRFAGRNAIVTGAASGIGQATALRLVAEGAHVLGVDMNAKGLAETAAGAEGFAGRFESHVANLSREDEAQETVAGFVGKTGALHVLINMAGIIRTSHIAETSLAAFMECVNINLGSTFLMCREALPWLEKTGGNIVNAASTTTSFGGPYLSAYAASKGAIASLTKSIAWEYMRRGVRANAVAPGSITTGITHDTQANIMEGVDWSLYDHLSAPNGFGDPDAIAGVIAMLASDDGYHVNGEIVRVDGGTHS